MDRIGADNRRRPVPAEVIGTSDRLIGNITLIQAGLLSAPLVFVGILVLLPPLGQFHGYKFGLGCLVGLIFGCLAFRLQGRLGIDWLRLLIAYQGRQRQLQAGDRRRGGRR